MGLNRNQPETKIPFFESFRLKLIQLNKFAFQNYAISHALDIACPAMNESNYEKLVFKIANNKFEDPMILNSGSFASSKVISVFTNRVIFKDAKEDRSLRYHRIL